jgi:hypothetical protein
MVIPLVQDLVRTHYVFPDIAERIAAGLDDLDRASLAGADEAAQAETLSAALQSVNGDRHLRVRHYPEGVPPEDDDATVLAWFAQLTLEQGPGITEVRRLEGNTGLLVVGPVIPPPELLAPAAVAAFTLLQGVTRLVLDLRDCIGGVPESVALVVSHLTGDEPVHLQDLVARDGTVMTSTSTSPVSPRLAADVPIDVLTSARTFSGGEELAYDLQALGRARVIGETTGGGAHPREGFDLTSTLQLHVPIARSVHAVTGTNWEGSGVVPDVACPAEKALELALQGYTP